MLWLNVGYVEVFKSMKNLFENYKSTYEQVSKFDQRSDFSNSIFLSNLIDHQKKKKILDVGCAEGKLVVTLAENGHSVTGADISNGFLKKTRRLAQSKNVKVDTVQLNIEETILPLNNNQFDVIYFADTIEHLKNPTLALHNIRRLLKNKGILIIYTPNALCPNRIFWFFFYWLFRQESRDEIHNLHFILYDYQTLAQTLTIMGFKIQNFVPTYIPLPIRFLNHQNPLTTRLATIVPFFSESIVFICSKSSFPSVGILMKILRKYV